MANLSILREMPEYFDFSSLEMHIVPVWVKFPNLPLKCWSLKCLSKIASVLGKPIQSDMLTFSMSRLSYTRVLVEVNLLSNLPCSIEVILPNGSLLQVVYETLPRFCKHCRTLGHITSTCTKSLPPIVPSQQQTLNPAPAPQDRDSVFHWLGPQVTTLLLIAQRQICLLTMFLIQSRLKLSLSLRMELVPLTLEAGKLFSVEK